MKRKTVVRIHLVATIIAVVTIATFFTISLIAEIRGDQVFNLICASANDLCDALPGNYRK